MLSYSIIMLNTDQHNPQVKHKMTLEQFIRNNRGTNGGADYPRETLEAIFHEIRGNEIKLADELVAVRAGFDSARWGDMARVSEKHPDAGRMLSTSSVPVEEAMLYDEDLFQVAWSPAISATCVVFDFPVEEAALKEALDGFLGVARIAGHRGMTTVMDQLVTTLCAYAMPANAGVSTSSSTTSSSSGAVGVSQKPSVLFGEDDRKRTALVTVFTIATRWGDCIRAGWCPLVDVVLRLHKLDLLSGKVRAGLDVDNADGGPMLSLQADADGKLVSFREFHKAHREAAAKLSKKTSQAGSSILRGFSQLLSLDDSTWGGGGHATPPPLTAEEQSSEDRATRCVEKCGVDAVFAHAQYLGDESLGCLARALTWAAGPAGAAGAAAAQAAAAAAAAKTGNGGDGGAGQGQGCVTQETNMSPLKPLSSPKGVRDASAAVAAAVADEDGAAFCLDVLVAVTLRNPTRCRLLLPHTYGYLRAIVQSAKHPSSLVERAVFELLRLCRQMLPALVGGGCGPNASSSSPSDSALADDLLDALRLTFALEPNVADGMITRIAFELKRLVETAVAPGNRGHGDLIRTAKGWDTVCKLAMASARHPDASKFGFEALSLIVQGGESKLSHTRPWNVRACLEATSAFVDARQGGDERSIAALGLIGIASDAIGTWCAGEDGGAVAVAAFAAAGGDPATGDPASALALLRKEMLSGPWSDITSYLRRYVEARFPNPGNTYVLPLTRL